MGVDEQLQQLELLVGRVVAVREHAGARAPSYVLTIDLGPRGEREATVDRGAHGVQEIAGRQLVCAVRGDEVVVLAARSHAGGVVLLAPEREVENGTPVA